MRKRELSQGDRATGGRPAGLLEVRGDGWAALPRPSTSLRLVLLPFAGAFAGARPSRRAVSCDRVSLSSRKVSLRPHPRGFHASSAGPRPAVVGGNTVVSERGRVGFRCLLQTPSNER